MIGYREAIQYRSANLWNGVLFIAAQGACDAVSAVSGAANCLLLGQGVSDALTVTSSTAALLRTAAGVADAVTTAVAVAAVTTAGEIEAAGICAATTTCTGAATLATARPIVVQFIQTRVGNTKGYASAKAVSTATV